MIVKFFIKTINNKNSLLNQLLKSIDVELNLKIKDIILQLLIGFILSSIMIFAIVQLSLTLNDFLDQFRNGIIFKNVVYFSMLLISGILILKIFRRKNIDSYEKTSADMQTILTQFIIGFIEAYIESQNNIIKKNNEIHSQNEIH